MMPQGKYLPEGRLLQSPENQEWTSSEEGLRRAMLRGSILEGVVTMCDEQRNLHIRLGAGRGIIPYSETGLGVQEGKLREIAILSRVGKPVCFRVTGREGEVWKLSRRVVQEEADAYLRANLSPGQILPVTVTHLERFGAFVDIGCGLISMISIQNISVSRIRKADDRFAVGQHVYAAVLRTEPTGRVCLTHKELLGTWQQNAQRLRPGTAVRGIVRGVESYGIFIELFPNLSGLAEPCGDVAVGSEVSVYIKSILPERMKIKLAILNVFPGEGRRPICPEDYFLREGQLRRWQYQPEVCVKSCVETVFS